MAALSAPFLAFAVDVSLTLSSDTASPGDEVIASGIADADTFVTIKVLDKAQQIVVFDAVKSNAQGNYSASFKVPANFSGTALIVVAGYGGNVDSQVLTVDTNGDDNTSPGSNSGGGGSFASQAVNITTGKADVDPGAGGTISLGSEASVNIPAGALQGTKEVNILIEKLNSPPAAPSGYMLLGSVFEFKVGGKDGYSFVKPVTLTFTFAPASLTNGETPSVYYYDEASAQWVNLGGTISGNTITVSVSHFTRFTLLAKEAALSPVAEQLFSDVPSSYWAGDFIFRLNSLGYISGYPDGTFRPDTSITRAEFATVLVKAFKLPVTAGKVFGDTNSHWAVNYIATAYAAGIATGYNDDSFGPEDLITREQMAVLIVKAAKIKAATTEITCTDSDQTSAWARDALAAAAQNGIMKGYPDGSFNPQGKATRAEAVAVIANALQ